MTRPRPAFYLFIVVALLLQACGGSETSNTANPHNVDLEPGPLPNVDPVQIPTDIVAAGLPDNGQLLAVITQNGQTLASQALVDGQADVSFYLALSPGTYQLDLTIEFESDAFGRVSLTDPQSTSIEMIAGQTNTLVFLEQDYSYPNNDDDLYNNLVELQNGTDPNIDNEFFFISANDGISGDELYVTDGADFMKLVKDINTNTNAYPQDLVEMNGAIYFTATDGVSGRELWRSDDSVNETVLVKDINLAVGKGSNPSNLTVVGSGDDARLYFIADNESRGCFENSPGNDLWVSDGTTRGTYMVKGLLNAICNSSLTTVAEKLYFVAFDGVVGSELWVSDISGDISNVGANLVKDINAKNYESGSPMSSSPRDLTAMGSKLFFGADDGGSGAELWVSDGTAIGTRLVKDINVGVGSAAPLHLTQVGSTLYFRAHDGVNGYELWASDGTEVGTYLVKDIYAGSNSSIGTSSSNVTNFTAVGSKLFFQADDGIHGLELWVSDGTLLGTKLVKDIYPGINEDWARPNSSDLAGLTALGSKLYFKANDGVHGNELWVSDGTAAGTSLFIDINVTPSGEALYSPLPSGLTAVGSKLYFEADDGIHGAELWVSDGTVDGTFMNDINTGVGSSSPNGFLVAGDAVYFSAYDGVNGWELWQSSASTGSAHLLHDIGMVGGNAYISGMTTFKGIRYFSATDRSAGNHTLWRTDGTSEGTFQVSADAHGPEKLTVAGESLFFVTFNSANGAELWVSDGTSAGTLMVKDINEGANSSYPRYLTALGSKLYFQASDGVNGETLWVSDGTSAGTIMAKEIRSGSSPAIPSGLIVMGSKLYFGADNGVNGYELWVSDGSSAGTLMVKDIRIGSSSSELTHLTVLGSKLYFRANDGINGSELWVSDGSAGGTFLLKNIYAGSSLSGYPNSSAPYEFTVAGSKLYFRADDGIHGAELWVSDGTEAGTRQIADISSSLFGSSPSSLRAAGSKVYFRAYDGQAKELWVSDGTEAGTVRVTNFGFDFDATTFAVGETLYFSADDGSTGQELWKSDGSEGGAELVMDLYVGAGSGLSRILVQ